MDIAGKRRPLWLAVIATLVLVVFAAGCGSSDDDGDGPIADGGGAAEVEDADDGGGGESGDATETPGADAGGPRAQIRALYGRFVDAIYDGDAETACSMLTAAARKQYVGDHDSCEAAMRVKLDPANLSENRPFIVSIAIRSPDNAIARGKTKNSDIYTMPLAKQDGQWKINGGF